MIYSFFKDVKARLSFYVIIVLSMSANLADFLSKIQSISAKPALFEPGEPHFWDDPYISKSMLEAHLDPEHDAASRRPEIIEKEISNLLSAGILKPGQRVLDLGCGPGLYAGRLFKKGIKVTGVDISDNSLNYAITQAISNGLDIEYRCLNFFDIDYSCEFDAVFQAYGEIGTYSDIMRDKLLSKLYRALKPEGLLIFDVTAPPHKPKAEPRNRWYISEGGFWRQGLHLVLEQQFDYPEDNVRVKQYIIMDENKISVYRSWFHDYTLDSIKPVLEKAGFKIVQLWNDLVGTPYKKGGEWLAIVAGKR
jgi:SAM-dependent methyltransferase